MCSNNMVLTLGGFIKGFVLLGIFAVHSTAAVTEEGENRPFITAQEDANENTQIVNENVRDVYLVSANGDSDYVEFVQEAVSENIKSDGYINLKTTGNDIQRVEENTEQGGINLEENTDSTSENIFKEIVDVLIQDDVRSNVIVLAKSNTIEEERWLDSLFTLISTKRTRIDFLTMGATEQGTRKKRAAPDSFDIFQQIAQASGGMVIQTTKHNIGSVVSLLKQTLQTYPVDLMRFEFIRPVGQYFKVLVDDTMTQLTLQIQTPTALPAITITMPLGTTVPSGEAAKPFGSKLELFDFNITKPSDYGQWKVTKLASSEWDVSVRGQSPVDFTHAFLEPGPGGIGLYPIKGRPVIGKTYQLSIKVPQIDKIKNVYAAMLLDNHNIPFGMYSLKNIGGRGGKTLFTDNVTIPKFDFKVAINGWDKTSHQIRRLDPVLVSPVSIRLLLAQSISGMKLYVNDTLDIPFTVINEAGKQQNVLIKIEDNKNFAESPVSLLFTLRTQENVTKHFTIKGGMVAGITTTVIITAKPYVRGQQTKGQFEMLRFTVEDRQRKQTSLPTTSTTTAITTPTIKISASKAATTSTPPAGLSVSTKPTVSSGSNSHKMNTVGATGTGSSANAHSASTYGKTGTPGNISAASITKKAVTKPVSATQSPRPQGVTSTSQGPFATKTTGCKASQKVAASSDNSSHVPESMVVDITVEAVGDISDVVVRAVFSKRAARKKAKFVNP